MQDYLGIVLNFLIFFLDYRINLYLVHTHTILTETAFQNVATITYTSDLIFV